MTRKFLFVCPHGVAKSVIARAYFQHLADQCGLNVASLAVGIDPEATVWPTVMDLLRQDGLEVTSHHPLRLTQADLDTAVRVIALGCDLADFELQRASVKRWDDIPLASQDLLGARDAIRVRVTQLVDEVRRIQEQNDE
jgi:arsenate reductase (thioredoxin)